MRTYETLEDATSLANEVLSGSLDPHAGCGLIASIAEKLNFPSILLPFTALAHDQEGHERFGLTAEGCIEEIKQACQQLADYGPQPAGASQG